MDDKAEFCHVYFSVYQYVPENKWDRFNKFFSYVLDDDWNNAENSYRPIIRLIADLLKELPQVCP